MPEPIIELFEEVQVHHQQRETSRPSPDEVLLDDLVQVTLKCPVVAQPGQRIPIRARLHGAMSLGVP